MLARMVAASWLLLSACSSSKPKAGESPEAPESKELPGEADPGGGVRDEPEAGRSADAAGPVKKAGGRAKKVAVFPFRWAVTLEGFESAEVSTLRDAKALAKRCLAVDEEIRTTQKLDGPVIEQVDRVRGDAITIALNDGFSTIEVRWTKGAWKASGYWWDNH